MPYAKRISYRLTMPFAAAGLALMAPAASTEENTTLITLDTVTVTATRSGKTNIQDVPIAVTARTGDELQARRVLNIENVAALSPSIAYQQTNNAYASAGLIIRGIGSVGNNRSFEGSVGVFVDGVYRSRPGQVLQNFFDVESAQILRGPQGTLFGKNTSAGAILIDSKQPEKTGYAAGANLTIGNFATHRLDGYLNFAVSDQLALRVAGSTNQSDGEWTNLVNNSDYGGGSGHALRLSALWDVNSNIELLGIADWGEFDRECCYATADLTNGPWVGLASALTSRPVPATADPFDRKTYIHGASSENQSDWGITLKPRLKSFLGGELKGILAYREWESMQSDYDALFDAADVLRISEGFQNEQTSFELIYTATPTDKLSLLTGLYLSDETIFIPRQSVNGQDAEAFFDVFIPSVFSPLLSTGGLTGLAGQVINTETYRAENDSLGIFARADYDVTDRLSVFGGLRWSQDKKDAFVSVSPVDSITNAANLFGNLTFLTALRGGTVDTSDPNVLADLFNANVAAASLHPFTILANIPVPGNGYSDRFEDDALSWTIGATYKLTNDLNFYGSANRGYKSGGVNLDTGARGGAVQAVFNAPETPIFESEFTNSYELGAKLTYLGGRAEINIAVFHTNVEDLQIAGFDGLLFTVLNVKGAQVSGLEIEHRQQLSNYFSVDAALTWLQTADIERDADLEAGESSFLSGRDLTRAPELAANVALMAELPIDQSKSLFGQIMLQYQGEHLTSPSVSDNALNTQEAYTLVNLSGGLEFDDQSLSIELFCQNCLDEEYVDVHFNQPIYNIGADDINGYLGKPRTYGITLRKEF